jgi:hypothetical protein
MAVEELIVQDDFKPSFFSGHHHNKKMPQGRCGIFPFIYYFLLK